MLNRIKEEMLKRGIPVETQPNGSLCANVSDYGSVGTMYANREGGTIDFALMSVSPTYEAYEILVTANAASCEVAQKSIMEAVSEFIVPYGFRNLLELEWGNEDMHAIIKFPINDCSTNDFAENAVATVVEFMTIMNANGDAIINKAWQRCAINNHAQAQAFLSAAKVAARMASSTAITNFSGIFKAMTGTDIDLFTETYQ
jgi:hypothetical protein